MSKPLIKRYEDIMVATVIADSTGVPHEHYTAAEIAADLAARGGLYIKDYFDPWAKRAGKQKWVSRPQPSDDANLTGLLGIGLAISPEFDPEYSYNGLRSFMIGRNCLLTGGAAYGHGKTLKAALEPPVYADSVAKFARGEVPLIPTNGSLMRNVVVALRHQGQTPSLVQIARRQSRLTHQHPLCEAACMAHAVFVSYLLYDLPADEAWEETQDLLSHIAHAGLKQILALSPDKPNEDEIWPHSGEVSLSLRVALWASVEATSFMDGLEKVIRIGGDTDTYATIAAGPLAARFGIEDVPADWLVDLPGADIMKRIARDLYELRYK